MNATPRRFNHGSPMGFRWTSIISSRFRDFQDVQWKLPREKSNFSRIVGFGAYSLIYYPISLIYEKSSKPKSPISRIRRLRLNAMAFLRKKPGLDCLEAVLPHREGFTHLGVKFADVLATLWRIGSISAPISHMRSPWWFSSVEKGKCENYSHELAKDMLDAWWERIVNGFAVFWS